MLFANGLVNQQEIDIESEYIIKISYNVILKSKKVLELGGKQQNKGNQVKYSSNNLTI